MDPQIPFEPLVPTPPPSTAPAPASESPPATASTPRLSGMRRGMATFGLALGLLVVGGAAVVMAASPEPSSSAAPGHDTEHPAVDHRRRLDVGRTGRPRGLPRRRRRAERDGRAGRAGPGRIAVDRIAGDDSRHLAPSDGNHPRRLASAAVDDRLRRSARDHRWLGRRARRRGRRRSGRRRREPGRSRTSVPLGVRDEARHRVRGARRCRRRPPRSRRAGRPARRHGPAPACPRLGAPVRGRDRPRPTRNPSDLLESRASTSWVPCSPNATASPFEDALKRRILGPLAMNDTQLVSRASEGLQGPLSRSRRLRPRAPAPDARDPRDPRRGHDDRLPGPHRRPARRRAVRSARLGPRLRAPRRQGPALDGQPELPGDVRAFRRVGRDSCGSIRRWIGRSSASPIATTARGRWRRGRRFPTPSSPG